MTTKEMKEIYTANTNLEKEVIEIIENECYGDLTDWFNDLFRIGCANGMISSLVYFSDTLSFVQRHAEEVNELLGATLEETGMNNPKELFGERWEAEDVLCLDVNNRNLLAWFAFETIAYKICTDLNLEEVA